MFSLVYSVVDGGIFTECFGAALGAKGEFISGAAVEFKDMCALSTLEIEIGHHTSSVARLKWFERNTRVSSSSSSLLREIVTDSGDRVLPNTFTSESANGLSLL